MINKTNVFAEVIRLKESELAELREFRSEKIESGTKDNSDFDNLMGSPKYDILEEADMVTKPMAQLIQDIELLKSIDTESSTDMVEPGAIISTSNGHHFVVGVGQTEFEVDGQKFTGLSVKSPVYDQIHGKGNDHKFDLGDESVTITKVY